MTSKPGHVFLSYVREDADKVDWLEAKLTAAGIPVWRDIRNLWPGDIWRHRLRDAIEADALAFVPCFSSRLTRRSRSAMYEELAWAADEYRRRPPDVPWIFPVLLDDCVIPSIDLGAGLTLHDLQWSDFAKSRDEQLGRLVTALRRLLQQTVWRYDRVTLVGPFEGRGHRVAGEFIGSSEDLALWNDWGGEEHRSPVIARSEDGYHGEHLLATAHPATRVRRATARFLALTHERERLTIFDAGVRRAVAWLPVDEIGDPIIRSEAAHPTEPLIVLGTDYGLILCWNWEENRIVFRRQFFPKEDIVWISGLAIDDEEDTVWFAAGNVLFGLAMADGQSRYEIELGETEETGGIACHPEHQLFAIGGIMATCLYRRRGDSCEMVHRLENRFPMTRELAFTPDGKVLGVVTGVFGPGRASLIDVGSLEVIMTVDDEFDADGKLSRDQLASSIWAMRFSESSELMALGQGARVGVYRRMRVQ
jgi:TIR domain